MMISNWNKPFDLKGFKSIFIIYYQVKSQLFKMPLDLQMFSLKLN